MDYAKYSDLKSKSKQAFKKIAAVTEVINSDGVVTTQGKSAHIVLETKRYDSNTGEEATARIETITLEELERDKASLTTEKAQIDAELTELGKMITDIKAL